MSEIQTVGAGHGQSITFETDVIAQCPVDSGIDQYRLEIRYLASGRSLECGSLQAYLDEFVGQEMSQEELADEIDSAINEALPEASTTITLTGSHDGVTVSVSNK